ncbi:hypothetical protein TNCV_3980051 [Trichonephila clavipes]|nr:hypothetical protein TNCV_3980051 [Trichonephila clavipes]
MSLCSSAEVGNTRSFPFSKRPSSGVSENFPTWSRSSVALLCASITMGVMRFPLRPTVVKPSSFSLLAPGAPTLPSAFAVSTVPTSHRLTFLHRRLRLRYSEGRWMWVGAFAPTSPASSTECLCEAMVWRLACFRFGCEAGEAAVGTRLNRSMSLM